jgi:tetratricopeptide (TPR) repeat protein
MENSSKTNKKLNSPPKKKISKFGIAWKWIVGMLFIFWGISALIQGFILIAIFDFIWVGIILPPISSFILKKSKINLTQQKKSILWTVFFILSIFVWQSKPEEPNLSPSLEYTQQGQIKLESGDRSSALKDFNKAIQLDPENHIALAEIGNIKFNEKKFEEALPYYNKALRIDNKYFNVYYNRGMAHYQLNNYAEAIIDFQKAITLNPDDPDLYQLLSASKMKLEDFTGSLKALDQAIEMTQDSLSYFLRGSTKIDLGNYHGAIQDFNTFIKTDTSNERASAYFNNGYINFFLEEHSEAIRNFDEAIKLNPNFAKAYAARGIVKATLGDMNGSREDREKSIQIDPSKEKELGEMEGFYQYKSENFEGALKGFNEAIKLFPNVSVGFNYYYRGLIHRELKKNKESCADLFKSKSLGFILAEEALIKFDCTIPNK